MKKISIFILISFYAVMISPAQGNPNAIIGKWMSTDNKLEVEVFKQDNVYKAKVIWFDDADDRSIPLNQRGDGKNLDKALRTRKVIGMEVMNGLQYSAGDNEWQEGRIYDASTGKDWNAKAWLTKDGLLKVRAFWHFEVFGENISFKKVVPIK